MRTLYTLARHSTKFALNGDLLHRAFYMPMIPMSTIGAMATIKLAEHVAPDAQMREFYVGLLETTAQKGQKVGWRAMLLDREQFYRELGVDPADAVYQRLKSSRGL